MPETTKDKKKYSVKLISEYDPETFKVIRRSFSMDPRFPVISLEGKPTDQIIPIIKDQVLKWKNHDEEIKPIINRVGDSIKAAAEKKKLKEAEDKLNKKDQKVNSKKTSEDKPVEKKEDINESSLFKTS